MVDMSKRILFIDDERDPPFTDMSDIDVARSSAEALKKLSENEYGEIWLDHDLGGNDTIMPVIDFLAEMAFGGSPLQAGMVIHTANPAGRKSMATTLQRWDYRVRVLPATSW